MDDTQRYKVLLERERVTLEKELEALGVRDPQNTEVWDVKVPVMDIMDADENEAADRAEEIHIDAIVLDELQSRYRAVTHALAKIAEDKGFGMCEICLAPIETERLTANPAARTCIADLKKEEGLV